MDAPIGTPVRAAYRGTVSGVKRQNSGKSGPMVSIAHGGSVLTKYMHLQSIVGGLKPGQVLEAGELIGTVGEGGNARGHPMLHFELWKDGKPRSISGWLGAAAQSDRRYIRRIGKADGGEESAPLKLESGEIVYLSPGTPVKLLDMKELEADTTYLHVVLTMAYGGDRGLIHRSWLKVGD